LQRVVPKRASGGIVQDREGMGTIGTPDWKKKGQRGRLENNGGVGAHLKACGDTGVEGQKGKKTGLGTQKMACIREWGRRGRFGGKGPHHQRETYSKSVLRCGDQRKKKDQIIGREKARKRLKPSAMH